MPGPGACVDYGDYVRLVGGLDTPGDASDVAVAGSHAYLAHRTGDFQVIDISSPAPPVAFGHVDVGEATCVAVAGGYAFIGAYDGVRVVDVADPNSPVVVGVLPRSAFGITIAGGSTNVTNALAEGMNSKIQWIKRLACYRNRERFRNAIYFHLGDLDLYPEALRSTHPIA